MREVTRTLQGARELSSCPRHSGKFSQALLSGDPLLRCISGHGCHSKHLEAKAERLQFLGQVGYVMRNSPKKKWGREGCYGDEEMILCKPKDLSSYSQYQCITAERGRAHM